MKRATPNLWTLAGVFLLGTSALEARTWTEAEGGRTLEGDFLKVVDGKAWIRRPNGNVSKVELTRLSEDDQKFIAEQGAASGDEAKDNNAVFVWETDYKKALERAKAEKKAVLLDFTGSDWCGWCIRLKEEVFDKKEFKEYAKEHLVLVELDFPRGKELPEKLKEQNDALAQEHGIQGFPTIVLLDSAGKPVGKTGYREGGPQGYVEHLKEMLKGS